MIAVKTVLWLIESTQLANSLRKTHGLVDVARHRLINAAL